MKNYYLSLNRRTTKLNVSSLSNFGLLTTYKCRLFSCEFLVITAWNTDDPKSHVLNGFEYDDGRVHVPEDGRYYVYMQMYFNSRPDNNNNRVALFADNRILLMIHKDMSPGQENTGFAGGVFHLKRGEKIYVKVLGFNTKMWLGPNHSYFGAYLI